MTQTVDRAVAVQRAALLESLDVQVRDAVRREGIDPQRETGAVRRLVEDVLRSHDAASLTGAVAAVTDSEAVVSELIARVAGYGPLQVFLDDPTIEEIWINSPC
ncbi:MAG: hypothetical protein ACSLEW_11240 [Nocardioides sp.]